MLSNSLLNKDCLSGPVKVVHARRNIALDIKTRLEVGEEEEKLSKDSIITVFACNSDRERKVRLNMSEKQTQSEVLKANEHKFFPAKQLRLKTCFICKETLCK